MLSPVGWILFWRLLDGSRFDDKIISYLIFGFKVSFFSHIRSLSLSPFLSLYLCFLEPGGRDDGILFLYQHNSRANGIAHYLVALMPNKDPVFCVSFFLYFPFDETKRSNEQE